jgi:glycerol uptake facilitator-like aquaporin
VHVDKTIFAIRVIDPKGEAMLEKFIQAAVITFLLHLVVTLGSNNTNQNQISPSLVEKPQSIIQSALY